MRVGVARALVMVFHCSFCALVAGRNPRIDGPGKCKVTNDNVMAVQALLKERYPDHIDAVAQLEVSKKSTVCLDCFPQDLRDQIPRVVNRKRSVGTLLVGQPVANWTNDGMKEGRVERVASGGVVNGYEVKWAEDDVEILSVDDTQEAVRLGRWVVARDAGTKQKAERRHAKTAWERAKRAELREHEDKDEDEDDGDGDCDGGEGEGEGERAFTTDELKWLDRSLNRVNMFSRKWWGGLGTVGRELHNHLFGFETPGQMRRFYDHAFPDYHFETGMYGLGSYELMVLALLKMKTDRPWMEIEADMGALRGKGYLTSRVQVWMHRLGSFSKQALVGVPDAAYMDECIPEVYRECEMADVMEIGDGTVFLTETPRRGIFKQLKNQLYNEKTGRSGMLGESLCTPHGMNSIAADLFTGRTSEVNALKELIDVFKKVPAHKAFIYDKGAKALRCLLRPEKTLFALVWRP